MNAAWFRSRNEALDGLIAAMMDLLDPARLHKPLTAFLDRYVIGHKQGHADQLAALGKEIT